MNKREVLKGALAATASLASTGVVAQVTGTALMDAEAEDEIFLADMEPFYEVDDPSLLSLSREKFNQLVNRMERGEFRATWAADGDSIDYRHLASPINTMPFTLEPVGLERLFEENAFSDRLRGEQTVIFALRGCEIAGVSEGGSVQLREAVPDHLNFRCVIGVLKRDSRRLHAFTASTVPNAIFMEVQRQGLEGCNLLPTGCHVYVIGTHGASFAPPRRQPGAVRQASGVCVLRARSGLEYTIRERWDAMSSSPHYPSDNIHAASLDLRAKPPFFSSKGCQVIPGGYDPPGKQPRRTWAKFRTALGLSDPPVLTPPDYGTTFHYVLLTGREARLVSQQHQPPRDLRRLRYGSQDARVAELRKRLNVSSGSLFDRETLWALISWQKSKFGWADGILAPDHASALGI